MDVETFLKETRGSVASQITKELQDLNLAQVQTTSWIRCEIEVEVGDGNVIKVNTIDNAFNSQTTSLQEK